MTGPIYSLTKSELYFILAIFILGFILGILLLNLYTSKKIDYYMLENKILMDKLQNLHNNIEKLNKTINKHKQHMVQNIEIVIQSDLNDHTRQGLKKRIINILDSLIGTEIIEINTELLIKTVDERNIIFEDKNYSLNLVYIILSEKTTIALNIK